MTDSYTLYADCLGCGGHDLRAELSEDGIAVDVDCLTCGYNWVMAPRTPEDDG